MAVRVKIWKQGLRPSDTDGILNSQRERTGRFDSAYVIFVRIFAAVSQAGILFLTARYTPISQFGIFSIALATTAIAAAFFGFGWTAWLLRLRAEGRARLIGPVLRLASLAAVFSSALIAVVLSAISGPQLAIMAASAIAMADGIGLACQNLLYGELRLKKATTTLLLCRLSNLSAVVIAIVTSKSVFLALIIGSSITIAISLIMAQHRTTRNWTWTETLFGGVQYWKVSIWGMAQQLDVVIVGSMIGKTPAGAYSAGFRLASPVHIVTSSLNSIFVPKLSHEKSLQPRLSEGRRLILFGLIYSGVLIVCSPLAFYVGPLVLGNQFESYAHIFPIFVINSAISVINQLQSTRYYANDQAAFVARSSMIATITGLLCITGSLLIYKNIYLAAMGTILIQLILTLFLFVNSKRRLQNAG